MVESVLHIFLEQDGRPPIMLFYVLMIIVASTISIDIAINFMDSAFALMVIPTMVGTLLLAPKVLIESEKYFDKI